MSDKLIVNRIILIKKKSFLLNKIIIKLIKFYGKKSNNID